MTKKLPLANFNPHLPHKTTLYGIALMLAAMFFFNSANVFIKVLSSSYPISEILFIRFLLFLIVLTPMALFGKNKNPLLTLWKLPSKPLLLFRGLLVALSLWSIFYGVQNLPLANVSILMFGGVFFVSLLAIPMLKETISFPQGIALFFGFGGILIILRPGLDFFSLVHVASYVVLMGALMDAFVLLCPKKLISKMSMNTIIYSYALFAFPFICLLLIWEGWIPITTWREAGCFLGQTMTAGLGQLCAIKSVAYAPAATLAPMIFSSILWSVLFGFLFWGEIPDTLTILGSLVVIGTGYYVVQQENKATHEVIPLSQGGGGI